MGHRRKNVWRSYRLLDVHGSGRPAGACVVAPVNSVTDIVEMCATISYINSTTIKYNSGTRLSSLRANAVFTARASGHWRTQVFVVFRTLSGPLPAGMGENGAEAYKVPGSEYQLHVRASEPDHVSTRRVLTDNTAEESLLDAVRTACTLIHEAVDPNSLSFKDTVSSRLRYLKRFNTVAHAAATTEACLSSSNEEDSDSTYDSLDARDDTAHCRNRRWAVVPPIPPGLLPPVRAVAQSAVVAFKKPIFSRVEDLFFSFATHVFDNASGHGRPVDPLKPIHLVDKARFFPQPLVFCHAIC